MVWQTSGMRGPKTMRWKALPLVSTPLAVIAVAVAKYMGASNFTLLLVGIGAALFPVLMKILSQWALKNLEDRRQIRKLAPGIRQGRLPKARKFDILQSPRLHAAAREPTPYVSRDSDPDIESRLQKSNRVLVVGNAMAGKTRSLLEAMARLYPNFSVWIPTDAEQLKSAIGEGFEPRRTAIVLDDLERFVVDGLTEVLEGLVESNVVLASIRSADYERLQPYGDIKPIGWDLCSWLGEPVWFLGWSPDEIDRAQNCVPKEYHEALERDGLSAFIGGGRILANRLNGLRAKNGAAFAITQFARDWRAFSASAGFSPDVFEALREYYPHSGEYHRGVAIDELLAPVFSDVALAEMDGSRIEFSDYIDELVEPTTETRSPAYWESVINVADDRDRVNIGAYVMRPGGTGNVDLAKLAFSRSKEPLAAVNLANMHASWEPVDLDRAEELLRPYSKTLPEAAFSLGVVLEKKLGGESGANDESRQLYEFAATKDFEGLPAARHNVANYLLNDEEPDLERAESLLRLALESGHELSAIVLARMLIYSDRVEEGLNVLEPILGKDVEGAALLYAETLVEDDPAKAEEVARRYCFGIELASVLMELGGAEKAREVLEIVSGSDWEAEGVEHATELRVRAMLELGECTSEDAEEALGLNWDMRGSLFCLGVPLLQAGLEMQGIKALSRSFELGHVGAGEIIGQYYLLVVGDLESAEYWYSRSVDEAHPHSLVSYANFLATGLGDLEKARGLWMKALDLPCENRREKELVDSIVPGNLGIVFWRAGEFDKAEEYLLESISHGRVQAMWNLSALLRERGGVLNRAKSLYWKLRARKHQQDLEDQTQLF